MGNDEQITDYELEKGKSLFLPPEIEDIDGIGMIEYSLEEEYRKSRKNIAWKVYAVLFAFVSVLGGLAYASHLYFLYLDGRKEIVVTEYEGENLKEVLRSTRKAEMDLAASRDAMKKLHEKMTEEIEAIRTEGEKKREEIKNKNISSGEKSKMISAQRKEEKNQISAVTLKYDKMIEEKEEEIAASEKLVKESREKMDEGIIKASSKLSNSERLTQMRLEKQKSYYVDMMNQMLAVYDPEFRNRSVKSILKKNKVPYGASQLDPHSRDMAADGGLSEDEYNEIRNMKDDFKTVMSETQKIPYKHSMKPALQHIYAFHSAISEKYENFIENLLKSNREKKYELNSFNYAFEHLTKINPETGYIIDSRKSNEIMVYVNPVVRIEAGFRGTVFRRDDEEIGVIEFISGTNGSRAKIVNIVPGKNLQPFDRVLIEYRR